MDVRFEHDPSFTDDLTANEQFQDAFTGMARGLKSQVKLPGRGLRSGPFLKKWFAEPVGTGRGWGVAVGTRWRLGHIIEFGSVNNPAYAPLRKAVAATGMRYQDGGR
jgi:hypothetical protein